MTTEPGRVHRSGLHVPRLRARDESKTTTRARLTAGAMPKYAAELIGTFFLMLTVATAVGEGAVLAAVAIGSALMVMVYATGHISGGHLNPAVSLAAFVRGRLGLGDLVPYWVAQVVGALLAALVGMWLVDIPQADALSGRLIWEAFVAELLFTFALAFVVLNVATSKDHPDNHFYGLAIGFTVLAGAVAVGPISGAAFNPAVALGMALSGLAAWGSIWVYLLACLLGGALAGVVFQLLNPDDA
jgi:aquaporin Z